MDITDILPKDRLELLYLKEKLTDQQIADRFHLSLGQVHRLRRKFQIRTLEQFERHHKNKLAAEEKSLILGLCLGDGHIRKRKGKDTYPQLMIEQSVKHKEYIYWLKTKLNNWIYDQDKPITAIRKFSKVANKHYHSLSFQTICHPALEEFYKSFYKSGKKVLAKELIVKYFDKTSLAVWMMDDGTLSGNCKRNSIATNNFTFEEVNFLRDVLRDKFDLKTWICKRTGKYTISYEIAFDKKSSLKITEIIGDIVIDSMKYKLLHSETAKGTA